MYKILFFSNYIYARVKIILCQSLIRPILIYGCQIWYNISPSYMEKIGVFKGRYFRACTSFYRSPKSNYKYYNSNKKLYNRAKICRIDNFIISLIRNHIIRITACTENNLILTPYYTNEQYIQNSLLRGYVPPEAFLYLNKHGFIQNENGIPIFYHIYRRTSDKNILCKELTAENRRFDTNIYMKDTDISTRIRNKYWGLTK